MMENEKITLESLNPWWFGKEFDTGIPRLQFYENIIKYLSTPEIILLAGARRTGKSTLLFQVIKSILMKEPKESVLMINFDEPIFQSKYKDPGFLMNIVSEIMV